MKSYRSNLCRARLPRVSSPHVPLDANACGIFVHTCASRPSRLCQRPSNFLLAATLALSLLFSTSLPAVDLDPVLRGTWPDFPRGYAQAVAIQNGYAYVALGGACLAIFDVRNPANPRQVGGYDTGGYAYGVAVSGNYAYLADGSGL
jgi:hypothetical protein